MIENMDQSVIGAEGRQGLSSLPAVTLDESKVPLQTDMLRPNPHFHPQHKQTCMVTTNSMGPNLGLNQASTTEPSTSKFKMAALPSATNDRCYMIQKMTPPLHIQTVANVDLDTPQEPSFFKMAVRIPWPTTEAGPSMSMASCMSSQRTDTSVVTTTKDTKPNLGLTLGLFTVPSISASKMAAKESSNNNLNLTEPESHISSVETQRPNNIQIEEQQKLPDPLEGEGMSKSNVKDIADEYSSSLDGDDQQGMSEEGQEGKDVGMEGIDKGEEGYGEVCHHNGTRVLRQRSNRRPVADRFRQKRQTLQDMARPLKHWLYRHRSNPYPTKAEKSQLAVESAMSLTQVSNWFANARRRLKNTVSAPGLSWGHRISLYNSCVEGNAERLSICGDDSDDGNQQETLSSPHHPTPTLPPHGPQYESCPQGHQGEAFGGLLQRYLDDAYERSLQPTDRRRHQSGSLSSHDHDDWSTSSCGSPTRGLDDPIDGLEVIARQLQNVSSDGDDLYLKELSAALALTTLRYRRLNDMHL